jgi:CubicO group peptidase (beta-lactamase class C family)
MLEPMCHPSDRRARAFAGIVLPMAAWSAVATAQGPNRTTTADGSPLPARFHWASAGKAATAAVILDLAERGKLSVRDSVSRWLPEFPRAGSPAPLKRRPTCSSAS